MRLTEREQDVVCLALDLIETGYCEFSCKALDVASAMIKANSTETTEWFPKLTNDTKLRQKYRQFYGENDGLWLRTSLPAAEKKEIRILSLLTFLEAGS